MKWELLCLTQPGREAFLSRLQAILCPQLEEQPDVKMTIRIFDRQKDLGSNRQDLLEGAQGEYVNFIDDDDLVTDNYVREILRGIDLDVDVVCVNAIHTTDGRQPKLVVDIHYQEWSETSLGYLRGVQFRDAVKRDIATMVPYPDIRFGEDHAWTRAIEARKLIKTWHLAKEPTYFHLYLVQK